jgi:hypothetical protein
MATTKISIPPHYATRLPTSTAITALKQLAPVIIPANSPLHRAAWKPSSVLPTTASNYYRFGPPPVVAGKKNPPYWWLYVADVIHTCIYETGFCIHDKSRPGHFYIDRVAERDGQIASLLFPTELRLLDLRGDTAYHLGIHDLISRANHAWCQWLAYQLVSEGFFTGANAFNGILYPSRKNRSQDAVALHSGYVKRVRTKVRMTTTPFNQTIDYQSLLSSKLIVPAP